MWIGAFEGKIPLDVFAALMVALDDNGQLMKILVTALDRDKDGVVSEGEFQAIVRVYCLTIHPFRGWTMETSSCRRTPIRMEKSVSMRL